MYQSLKGNKKGFTIIEVLIVLAIAGLILLIVFLAVPALQRNARNTTRKTEASAIGGAIVEWVNNNDGKLPANATEQSAALANAKLQGYDGNVTFATSQTQPALTAASLDKAVVVLKAKCSTGGATVPGPSRAVAIQYMLETSGNPQAKCFES